MTRTVLFVHGTGVREECFANTFLEVEKRLSGIQGAPAAKPCFWGGAEGAKLGLDGASIPDYEETGGGGTSEEEERRGLWALLNVDPWYELRVLGMAEDPRVPFVPGQPSPEEALRKQMKRYCPGPAMQELLDQVRLRHHFQQAHGELVDAPEFANAANTAIPDPILHRQAISRALVARALRLAEIAWRPGIGGEYRDKLVEQLYEDLRARGLFLGRIKRSIKGIVTSYIARKATRKRGVVTDAAYPAAGDVLKYQARGKRIRGYIENAIDGVDGPVTVVAHSLGGIACVDLLIKKGLPRVERLITVGSQAPLLYEIDALQSLEFGRPLPPHFPKWLNIYDPQDLLSHTAAPVFNDARVEDLEVDNGVLFPESHSAYWSNPAVWEAVGSTCDDVRT